VSAEGGYAARVAGLFPISAAGEPGRAAEAAESVALVVRFLNHATRAPAIGTGPGGAADLSAVVGSLGQAVERWEQLCAQLAARVEDLSEDPCLYSTADGAASDHAWLAAMALRTAGQRSVTVAGLLGEAHRMVSALGHRDRDDDGDAGAGERR